MESITKEKLAERIAGYGYSKKQAGEFINIFKEVVVSEVTTGNRVVLADFLTIKPHVRKARSVVSPVTKETHEIPQHIVPKVTIGKAFKEALR